MDFDSASLYAQLRTFFSDGSLDCLVQMYTHKARLISQKLSHMVHKNTWEII